MEAKRRLAASPLGHWWRDSGMDRSGRKPKTFLPQVVPASAFRHA